MEQTLLGPFVETGKGERESKSEREQAVRGEVLTGPSLWFY